jgi:hypothetical protein
MIPVGGGSKRIIPRSSIVWIFCFQTYPNKFGTFGNKKSRNCGMIRSAEREGFEPSLRFRKHAFQACAFSHSATSPVPLFRGQRMYRKHDDYLLPTTVGSISCARRIYSSPRSFWPSCLYSIPRFNKTRALSGSSLYAFVKLTMAESR